MISRAVKTMIPLISVFCLQTVCAIPQKPVQNAKRVAEIAATLPDEPGFPSARIGNRKMWDSFSGLREAKLAVRSGAGVLAEPIPALDDSTYTNTVREHWGKVSDRRMKNLNKLVLAECLENKGRFLPLIRRYLDAISSQTTWMNPYHDRKSFGNFYGKYRSVDLNGSMAALNAAMALDTLKGMIPEDLKSRVMAAMRRNVLEPYLKDAAGTGYRHFWFFGHSNWNPACHSQCVGAALRVLEDKTARAKFIEGAERAVPFFLNGYSKEGYCQEGLDYWNYGFSRYLRLAHTVREATSGKVDLFAHEQAEKCYFYAYGFQLTENVSPQFGDGMASAPSKLNLFLGELAWPEYKCSFTAGLSPLSGHLELLPVMGGIPRTEFDSRRGLPPLRYPIRTFFEDAQVLICRPERADDNSVSVCIKGGHNGVPHNHNDAGQFIIALGGVQMVQDPAGKAYDFDTFTSRRYLHPMLNSYSHAVPLPDGTLQSDGKKYTAKILKRDFSPERDVITLDLKGAYNSSNILKLERRMTYDRRNRTVTVRDCALFAKPGAFESPLSTFGVVENGSKPGSFVIVRRVGDAQKRLGFTVDAHGAKWTLKEEKIPNPTRAEPTRWAVVIDKPSVRHEVEFVFSRR